jgi:hypothetical protein
MSQIAERVAARDTLPHLPHATTTVTMDEALVVCWGGGHTGARQAQEQAGMWQADRWLHPLVTLLHS